MKFIQRFALLIILGASSCGVGFGNLSEPLPEKYTAEKPCSYNSAQSDASAEAGLLQAILKQDESKALTLLSQVENVNFEFTAGITPLHLVAYSGQTKILEALIHKGSNLNATDCKGNTPLHYAAFSFSVEIFELLLKAGATPNYLNSERNSPLHFASMISPTIYQEGLKVSQAGWKPIYSTHLPWRVSYLFYAFEPSFYFNHEFLTFIQENENHVKQLFDLQQLEQMKLKMIELLIQAKADVYQENKRKEIPLVLSSYFPDIPVLNYYLNRLEPSRYKRYLPEVLNFIVLGDVGPDFLKSIFSSAIPISNSKPKKNQMSTEQLNTFKDFIGQVLAITGNPDQLFLGRSPLHQAAGNFQTELAAFLLEKGANPNLEVRAIDEPEEGLFYEIFYVDPIGNTPIFEAASNGDWETFQLIVSHGADLQHTNREGLKFQHQAVKNGQIEFLKKYLESASATLEVTDAKGRGLFVYAAIHYQNEMMQWLWPRLSHERRQKELTLLQEDSSLRLSKDEIKSIVDEYTHKI